MIRFGWAEGGPRGGLITNSWRGSAPDPERAKAACEQHAVEPLSWEVVHEDEDGNPVALEAPHADGRYWVTPDGR